MLLRKETGACQIGRYEWVNDGDVVEVDDDFGSEMLPHPGFSEVLPEQEPEAEPEKTPVDESDDDGDEDDEPEPVKAPAKATRRKAS